MVLTNLLSKGRKRKAHCVQGWQCMHASTWAHSIQSSGVVGDGHPPHWAL